MRRADDRLGGLLASALWWLGVPIFAFFMIYYPAQDLGGAWRAAHGGGTTGRLTTTNVQCGRHHCGASGTFVSDDGTLVVPKAYLDEAGPDPQVGTVYQVRYEGGRRPPVVYPANGSHDWILIAGFLIVAPIVLSLWAVTMFARLTHRWFWRAEMPE